MLALAAMLLPLLVMTGAGVLTFRSSVGGLEAFQNETISEFKPIERLRTLLEKADDVGETYVENDDPEMARRFEELTIQIDREFAKLTALDTPDERQVADAARARWEHAAEAVGVATLLPAGRYGSSLDDFHDLIDESGSLLANVYSLSMDEIADEISGLQQGERERLLTALAILVTSMIAAALLGRKMYRSIAKPLVSLETAASQFGSAKLSHRIPIAGDDELARVGLAFNAMADKLHQSRSELHDQALHDPLTGLANRTLFMERMAQAIARSDRKGTDFSVLYLDLDNFKAVNDTLGHEVGDTLLAAVSERLKESLRLEDTPARLGGDEFAVLLEEADLGGAIETAKRLTDTFGGTWATAASEVPITFSIGVAVREGREGLDHLLRRADAAMYAAKAAGKGQWQVFGPGMDEVAVGRQSLRDDLQSAVDNREFVVHYQPVVDLQTGAIQGVESLVRWDHPERGVLPPSEFLAEAEETGHILFIDRWVLQEASRQVRAWQEAIPAAVDLRAYVNLSQRQLQHPGLADQVAEALDSSGLAPEDLILEITETALVHETDAALTELRKVKELGVTLALDDFGTGYSSLAHLMNFPIDIIKLDRSFVSAIGGNRKQSDLALALVKLAKNLRLTTVAEGIETEGQFDYLRALDSELGQGYYFAKPLDASQLEKLLDEKGEVGLSLVPGRDSGKDVTDRDDVKVLVIG